jgi:hypothetical protein
MDRRYFVKAVSLGLIGTLGQGLIPNRISAEELNAIPIPFRRQRELAGFDELPMLTEENLQGFVDSGRLVRVLEETETYFLRGIPSRYEITTPWNKLFLERLSLEYHSEFGKKLQINSLSRTREYQRRLRRRNSNAVRPDDSGHVRAISSDLSYRRMHRNERVWMRGKLSTLQNEQALAFVTEPRQHVFHTMLFKNNYLEYVQRITGMSQREFQDYYRGETGV